MQNWKRERSIIYTFAFPPFIGGLNIIVWGFSCKPQLQSEGNLENKFSLVITSPPCGLSKSWDRQYLSPNSPFTASPAS